MREPRSMVASKLLSRTRLGSIDLLLDSVVKRKNFSENYKGPAIIIRIPWKFKYFLRYSLYRGCRQNFSFLLEKGFFIIVTYFYNNVKRAGPHIHIYTIYM